MGQLLFIAEALAAALLLTAVLVACISRIRRRLVRGVLLALLAIAAVLPWAGSTTLLWLAVYAALLAYAPKAIVLTAATAGMAVGLALLYRRGLRRAGEGLPRGRGAYWPLGRLTLAFLAAAGIALMTFWNLDLAVRQQLASMRAEAGAMAASVAPPQVPDSQNAALLYQQAADAIDSDRTGDQGSQDNVSLWLQPTSGAFDPKNEEMLAFLDRHRAVVQLLHRAGEMPFCNFGHPYTNLELIELPELARARARTLAKLLCLSARVNADSGRMVEAVKDVNATFAMASHAAGEPFVISTFVGIMIYSLAMDTLEGILAGASPSAEALDLLRMNEQVSFVRYVARSLTMEEAYGLSWFTAVDGTGGLSERLGGASKLVDSPAYRVFFLADDMSCYRKWMREHQQIILRPYYQSLNEWKRIGSDFGGVLTQVLLPGLSAIGEQAAVADAKYRACVLGVAAYRYRLKHGAWPEALDKLVPELLVAVPLDPFTGKPMIYGTDKAGRRVIYSVGRDLVDDGGAPWDWQDRKGDIGFHLGK